MLWFEYIDLEDEGQCSFDWLKAYDANGQCLNMTCGESHGVSTLSNYSHNSSNKHTFKFKRVKVEMHKVRIDQGY